MKQLTREQQAVFNFQTSMSQLRPIVEDDQSIHFVRWFDSFESSISSFITSELNFRQAERCDVLKVYPDLGNHSRGIGNDANKAGISYLKNSIEYLKLFKQDLRENEQKPFSFDRKGIDKIEKFSESLRKQIALMEIKGSDAKEFNETIEVAYKMFHKVGGEGEIIDFIIKKTDELIKIRSSKGRGAETNIAIWKLIAAAALFALASWVIWKCHWSRWRCSKTEKATYNTILVIAMITFGACE